MTAPLLAARAEPPAIGSLRRILDQGQIRILVSADAPPFADRADGGELAGYDVELGRLLAAGLGVKAEFIDVPRPELVPRLAGAHGDIIVHLPLTMEAAREVLLTTPAGRMDMSLIAPARTPVQRPAELVNWRVGLLLGREGRALARAHLPAGTATTFLPAHADLVEALAENRIDAVVLPRPVLAHLQQHRLELRLTHRFTLTHRWLAVGVPFGEHDLLRSLNSLLFLARTQGRLGVLSESLLGLPLAELPSF